MTTNTNDEAAFRQALLTSPGERPEVEYKSAVPFDDNTEFGLKLIKHILGMANAGGGWIVVGYEDDNLQPDASHSKEIAATYDTTRLSDTANRYVERGQSLKLSVYMEVHPETQISHPIIRVEGFERVPLICRSTKSASDTSEPILQSGKVYTRRPGAATSEIRSIEDWDGLLKLCVSQRRDEFLQEFADLFRRMSSAVATPHESSTTRFDTWRGERRDDSGIQELLGDGHGYMEAAQMLIRPQSSEWGLPDLRKAAISVRWPYIDRITAKQDGVEVRIVPTGSLLLPEYWYLSKGGSCYFSGPLREDHDAPGFWSSDGHPEKMLWVDLAIHRIGLELFWSAALYKELNVPPDEPYLFSIKYGGLRGRTIYVYRPDILHTPYPATSQEDYRVWQKEVTQDLVRSQLTELTHEIANSLFELFGFTHFGIGLVARLLSRSRTNTGQSLIT